MEKTKKTSGSKRVKLDTTADTYVLFLDMLEVEGLDNVEQVVGLAEKHPANPVIPLGDFHEYDSRRASNWAASLIYDEDDELFKAWYHGCDAAHWSGIGYAESADGVMWNKPVLNQFDYQGSKKNNMCWCVGDGATSHFEANKDYAERREDRRFQAVSYVNVGQFTNGVWQPGEKTHYFSLYSKDGKRWERSAEPLKWPTGDTGNFFYDSQDSDRRRRVKVYGQNGGGYGPDIEHLKPVTTHTMITPGEGREREIHFTYVIPYRGYYIMLYDLNLWQPFYGARGLVKLRNEQKRGAEGGIYIGDIRLAVCRDGLGKFERIQAHQPVVERGERGSWDSGFLVLGGGSGIIHNDEVYIFYTGVPEDGAKGFIGPVVPATVQTGLAKLRLDGFTYLQNRDGVTPGSMTTQPIRVKNAQRARLRVNAGNLVPYRDWIEVEVLDARTGRPIAGYTQDECDDVLTDSICSPVSWGRRRTLAGVKAANIRLRFHLYGKAKLYSFTFG